ncbi:MAG: hypothetical protein KDE58_31085, partial [Caldilineaceae bacterium]|nr:hypothetical protein [Caldilineaceae bacterium]
PFDGRESNGALTYWMLDTLAQADPKTTWKMVADRVSAKVHGQFEQQTPMLQGEGEYLVFGAEKLAGKYTVPVLKVDAANRRVRLNAGEAHGMTSGTQFAVYPNAAAIDDPTKQIAVVELTEVEAVEAWANVIEPSADFPIEVGMQAVLLNSSTVRVQRQVRVAIRDATLRRNVEAAIAADGRGFIALSSPGSGADFLVDITAETPATFVIQDSGGNTLPYLNPPLAVADDQGLSKLVARLVHLAQFRNVQMLDMPDPKAAAKLQVAVEGKRVNKPGESFRLKITNTQEPNPHDESDPTRVLNVTVLVLSSDWSITQLYPEGGLFQDINPGETIDLDFEAALGEGQTESLDIFKIFATRSSTNFRWLELPSLDQPIQRAGLRSPSADPLEQLLAASTGEKAETRLARLTSSSHQDKGWTVEQVEMLVTVDGKEPQRRPVPTAGSVAERDADRAGATPQTAPTTAQIDPRALGLA